MATESNNLKIPDCNSLSLTAEWLSSQISAMSYNREEYANVIERKTKRILSAKQLELAPSNTAVSASYPSTIPTHLIKLKAEKQDIVIHSWSNGVLLSELVANLMTDNKSMVKEVEHFDQYGRQIPQPKLLLSGTEAVVKSKAQAIHNIQLAISALQQIPKFPLFDYAAEELYANKNIFLILLRTIQSCFKLPYSANSSVEEIIASIKHRRMIIQRQPRTLLPGIGYRSHSAPPTVFMEAIRAVSLEEGFPRGRIRSKSNNDRRSIDGSDVTSKSSRSHSASNRRFKSPEPQMRHEIPQPTPSPSKLNVSGWKQRGTSPVASSIAGRRASSTSSRSFPASSSVGQHSIAYNSAIKSMNMTMRAPDKKRSKSITSFNAPERKSFDSIAKIPQVRALESKKERLLAQQRDRNTRRKSLLTLQEKEHYAKLDGKSENVRKVDKKIDKKIATDVPSSSTADGKRVPSLRGNSTTASPSDWPAPSLSLQEIAELKKLPIPQVTMAQITLVKNWLQSNCQLPILDGEGGYYSYQETRNVNSGRYPTSENNHGNSGSGMIATPPPLPLTQDRLRNGIFWCLLFHILEPALSQHSKLMHQTVHKYCPPKLRYPIPNRLSEETSAYSECNGVNTIEKATNILSKVFWLWRIKHCPPLSMLYLGQADEIIKCNKDIIWGLLYEIYQLYANSKVSHGLSSNGSSNVAGSLSTSFPFGNLKPLPTNYRPYGSGTSPLNRQEDSDLDRAIQKLPYSSLQRRSLDLSLIHWLGEIGVLQQVIGAWNPFPTSLTTLESYVKDGTLLCHMLYHVFKLPLVPSQVVFHPHTYSQCLSNIVKAIKVLTTCLSFPQRFLYSGVEEEIARGHWDVIYGLFEDLHLFYDYWRFFSERRDGSPYVEITPQKIAIKYPAGVYPYFGQTNVLQALQNPHSVDYAAEKVSRDTDVQSHTNVSKGPPKSLFQPSLDLRASYELDEHHDVSFLFNRPETAKDLMPSTHPSSLTILPNPNLDPLPDNFNSYTDTANYRYPSAKEMTALDPALQFLSLHEDVRHDIRSAPFPMKSIHSNPFQSSEGLRSGRTSVDSDIDHMAMKTAKEDQDTVIHASVESLSNIPTITPVPVKEASATDTYTTEEPFTENLSPDALQLSTLLDSMVPWLHDLVGYPLDSPSPIFHGRLEYLGRFFQDGVHLSRLVQKLTRQQLVGVELKPKTSGQKTQNIRKCLELLSTSNKRIPSRVLSCEEGVMHGEGAQVLRLLVHIKRAFPLYKLK